VNRVGVAAKGAPAAVDKYLLPREERVAQVRRHPAVLLVPSAQAVGGLLAAAILSATILRGHTILEGIVWLGWGILMARLVWDAVNWAVDYFVITSDRILLTSGVFTRSVAMMPLSKVTDMSFHRSFAGRLLGYGEFVVESAGKDAVLRTIDHIPYPEQLYLVVCGRIFKDAAKEEEEEFDDQAADLASADAQTQNLAANPDDFQFDLDLGDQSGYDASDPYDQADGYVPGDPGLSDDEDDL